MDCSKENKKKRKVRIKFKSLLYFISGLIFGSIIYGYINNVSMNLPEFLIWSFSGYILYAIACNINLEI